MLFLILVVILMKNKLPQYLKEYMNDYLSVQRNFSVHTVSSILNILLNEFLKFCINVKNIKITDISLSTFDKEYYY